MGRSWGGREKRVLDRWVWEGGVTLALIVGVEIMWMGFVHRCISL